MNRSGSFCPVHPFDRAVGPRMVDPGEAMLDAILAATYVEHVGQEARGRAIGIARGQAELDAVIGQHGVDAVRHCFDERDEEGRGAAVVGFLDQLHEGELAGAIDSDEQVRFALGGLHFGDVDVEETDRQQRVPGERDDNHLVGDGQAG